MRKNNIHIILPQTTPLKVRTSLEDRITHSESHVVQQGRHYEGIYQKNTDEKPKQLNSWDIKIIKTELPHVRGAPWLRKFG